MIDWISLDFFFLCFMFILVIVVTKIPTLIGLVLMGIGAFFVLSGSLGLLRLKDVYSKIHAVGVTDVMGASMMILGLIFLMPWSVVTLKMLLIILMLWIISPLTAHLLARFVLLKHRDKISVHPVPDVTIHYSSKNSNVSKNVASQNVNKVTKGKLKS